MALAGALAAAAGCGGAERDEGDGSDPFAAISQSAPQREQPTRSTPRWERVTTFSGSGPASKTITVARGALQWRARWRCESGDFQLTAQPPPHDGKPLGKAACPGQGQGVSIQHGSVRLAVTASGPWRVTIEQQIDAPLHEPPLPGMTEERLLERGKFFPVDKPGKGVASVYRLPNGRLALRIEDFQTTPNIDLFVWLSEAVNPRTTKQAARAPHVVVQEMKATIGDQNYLLPRNVEPERIRSIVIWCEPVQNVYTVAALKAPGGPPPRTQGERSGG